MSHLIKFGLMIASLLIIPGLFTQIYAQYDIPEIPSQEDIEKMMQQQEVSGIYTNGDYDVSIELPDGWSGMASNVKAHDTGAWISGFSAMKGGLDANMEEMQDGQYAVIMLSILDQSSDKSPPKSQSPSDDEMECDEITAEKIKINGKDVMKIQTDCSASTTIKTLSYHFATPEKIVMVSYAVSPASDFDTDLNTFENSVRTITIGNLIDVDYVIPDQMMIKSSGSSETVIEENQDLMIDSDNSIEITGEVNGTNVMMESDNSMETKVGESGDEMVEEILSPRVQMELGVEATAVICTDDKELMIKTSTGTASCIKSTSVAKLVSRGWGSLA